MTVNKELKETPEEKKERKRRYHREYYAANKEKIDERTKLWRSENKDRVKEYAKRWVDNNYEQYSTYNAEYRARCPEKRAEYNRAWRERNADRSRLLAAESRIRNRDRNRLLSAAWARNNSHKRTANQRKREILKIQATPLWADEFVIEEIYHLAKLRSELTGVKWHVDHIVPINSEIVCGLHVERNLQVIPGMLNISKGNRFWPDMP